MTPQSQTKNKERWMALKGHVSPIYIDLNLGVSLYVGRRLFIAEFFWSRYISVECRQFQMVLLVSLRFPFQRPVVFSFFLLPIWFLSLKLTKVWKFKWQLAQDNFDSFSLCSLLFRSDYFFLSLYGRTTVTVMSLKMWSPVTNKISEKKQQ